MSREGDVVLIYYQNQPSIYARIEFIEPDIKKDWYQVTLLLLTIPPQAVTWILREEYIHGAHFTMGGNPMRIEHVGKIAATKTDKSKEVLEQKSSDQPSKVIPFKTKQPVSSE